MIFLFMLTAVPGMTGASHHAQSFVLKYGLMNFFASLASNHGLSNLSLLNS
jgi:hypothetical protein